MGKTGKTKKIDKDQAGGNGRGMITLSKDYLNPFYFQSHTLAFHSQLQHAIPLRCITLCNAPL